jgi:hypothetical protein
MEKIILNLLLFNQTIFSTQKTKPFFGTAKGIKYIKNSYGTRCVQSREEKYNISLKKGTTN